MIFYVLYGKLQLLVQSPLSFVGNFNKQQEMFFTWLSLVSLCVLLTILEGMGLFRSAQCVILFNEENSKYAGLAQENSFGSA
jgi:hypothetical protein